MRAAILTSGGDAPGMNACKQRADYVVPCSTQSQFPDLWSAPLRRAHWMPTLGDPGARCIIKLPQQPPRHINYLCLSYR